MNNLTTIGKIKDKYPTLTDAEKKVADYIMKNAEYIPTMTTKELSQQSGASEASIVRFCKTVGVGSFKLLKVQLAKENTNVERNINDFSLMHSNDTPSSLFHKVTYFNKSAIEQTLNTVDRKELEKAIDTLKEARKLAFFGIGGSYPPAMDAQYKMMKLGLSAFVSSDYHYMISLLTSMTDKDALVLISVSGRTRETIILAEYAKKQGVPVIAITTLQKSPLYKLADIRLGLPHVEEEHRIGTIASRMTQLNMIDTLYLNIFRSFGTDVVEILNKSHQQIKEKRK